MGSDRTPPPSFSPATGAARPTGDDAVVVGRAPAAPPSPRRTAGSGRAAGQTPPVPPAQGRTSAAPPAQAGAAASAPPRASASRPASFTPGSGASGRPASGRPAPGQPSAAPGTPGARPANAGRPAGTPPAGTARASAGRPSTATRPAPAVPAGPRSTTGHAPGASRPAGPRPAGPPGDGTPPRRRRRLRWVAVGLVAALLLLLAWPIGLTVWADKKVQHTEALSGAPDTPGTTYLLTGSDSRADGAIKDDGTTGARADTILVLHVPESGPAALISLPRDTYVEIPGEGGAKLNAAYVWGGAPLLVETVEGLTGLTVDHYAEIGMGGVQGIVDAVGGVRLCYDADVDDQDSHMTWKAGCHTVGGKDALAFARMRKADPEGDIGRAKRQRQLIAAVMKTVDPKDLALHPSQQVALIDAGTAALTVDEGTGIVDMGRLALAFRAANGADGVTGTPPIADVDYRPGGIGSTVLLDPDQAPGFWAAVRDGELPPGKVGGME